MTDIHHFTVTFAPTPSGTMPIAPLAKPCLNSNEYSMNVPDSEPAGLFAAETTDAAQIAAASRASAANPSPTPAPEECGKPASTKLF
jgi:hypothetical protein